MRAMPLFVREGKARMGLPSGEREAPRRKSTCPPTPEKIMVPMESVGVCGCGCVGGVSVCVGVSLDVWTDDAISLHMHIHTHKFKWK